MAWPTQTARPPPFQAGDAMEMIEREPHANPIACIAGSWIGRHADDGPQGKPSEVDPDRLRAITRGVHLAGNDRLDHLPMLGVDVIHFAVNHRAAQRLEGDGE